MFLRRFNWYLAMVCLLVVSWSGCNKPKSPEDNIPVILISIDTLRSDRLPVYGYDQVKTPALDAFAKDALIYENAFAQVPLTLPSHATMLTGKLPTSHGVRDNIGFFLPASEQTLAEYLKAQGYQTGAVVSSMVLRKEVGLNQGFDFYQDDMNEKAEAFVRTYAQRDGRESLGHAKDWLNTQREAPFFLLFHLYDPHIPYTPPEPFASRYASAYDGEIAYTDSLLADFFKLLKQKQIYDRALIIVTSDHGEGLGDHEEMEHGMFVYREAIQVPLLVKLPKQEKAGTRYSTPVSLTDLAPSITSALGMPGWAGDGKPIFGQGNTPQKRPIYSESLFAQIHYGWHPQRSAIQDQWHFMTGKEEKLFDYQADPGELTDLFGQKRIPKPMLTLLEDIGSGANSRTEISEADRALLSSLGYAGLTSPTQDVLALSGSEIVKLKDAFNACHQLISQGKKTEAKTKLQEILQTFPTMMDARILLAVLRREEGAFDQVEHLLADGLANDPDNLQVITYLAEAKLRLGDSDGAQILADKAMAKDAQFAGEVLVPLYMELGFKEIANAFAEKMLEGSNSPNALFVQSRKAFEAGNFQDAAAKAQNALDANPTDSELQVKLLILSGESQAQLGRLEPARGALEKALVLDAKALYGRLILASILEKQAEHQANIAQLEAGLELAPESLELLLPLIGAQLQNGDLQAARNNATRALAIDANRAAPPLSFYFLKFGSSSAAVAFANEVLGLQPNSPYPQFLLGWVQHAKKQFQPALDPLNKAVEGAKQHKDAKLLSEAAFYLGDTYANLGKLREAVESFQLATQVRPDYPEAQVSLAAIYAMAGRTDDAQKILGRWLTQFPSPENRLAAKTLLTQFGLNELANSVSTPN